MKHTSHAPNDLATGGRRRPDGCRLDWFLGCLGRAIDGTDEALAAVLGKARHSGYRLLPGAGALVTLRATQSAPSTITMIPAATACERPTGVVPGIAVVAIAAA